MAGLAKRAERQRRLARWVNDAFGTSHALDVPQRGIRLAEEAIEAAQAAGCEREMVHRLVDYVFDRPAGDLAQEIGGVGLTLLALSHAAQLIADDCEAAELDRVLAKPLEHFAERNRAKNAAGFKVGANLANVDSLHRWPVEIAYHHDDGVRVLSFGVNELRDLHDVVERGPTFYSIASIRVGAARYGAPCTVEEADRS